MEWLRRLGVDFAAKKQPPVILEAPTPEPTPAELREKYSAELHAIDARLAAIGELATDFKAAHMSIKPTRTKDGWIRLVENFVMHNPNERAALEKDWCSLRAEAIALLTERNRIQHEGAPYWSAKK